MTSRWIATLLFISPLFASPASSHDLKGMALERNSGLAEQVAKALAITPVADEKTRSVIVNLFLWPVPRQLSICFTSGSPALRKKVTSTMQRLWPLAQLTEGRLTYGATFADPTTCGIHPSEDIRVAFVKGDGYWSYYGLDSRNYNPSMNLGFTDEASAGEEFDRYVGHETGHALGLAHEHQNPKAGNCQWNFDYISKHYIWKNDDEMHFNIDPLVQEIHKGKHAYTFLTYDKDSLMHYYFEPEAFLDGKGDNCYIEAQPSVPSDRDKDALTIAYGAQNSLSRQATRSSLSELTSRLQGQEYEKLRNYMQFKSQLLDH